MVANATRSGSRVTFTLTDYANTHSAVSGTAFFQAIWEHSVVTGGGPVEVTYHIDPVLLRDRGGWGAACDRPNHSTQVWLLDQQR